MPPAIAIVLLAAVHVGPSLFLPTLSLFLPSHWTYYVFPSNVAAVRFVDPIVLSALFRLLIGYIVFLPDYALVSSSMTSLSLRHQKASSSLFSGQRQCV